MEMIRTSIIAIFFAGITIGVYYFINNKDMGEISWEWLFAQTSSSEDSDIKIEDSVSPTKTAPAPENPPRPLANASR